MTYVDYFGFSAEINENQGCACRLCLEDSRACHCLQGIDGADCYCTGILCGHKTGRRPLKIGSGISSASVSDVQDSKQVIGGLIEAEVGDRQALERVRLYINDLPGWSGGQGAGGHAW